MTFIPTRSREDQPKNVEFVRGFPVSVQRPRLWGRALVKAYEDDGTVVVEKILARDGPGISLVKASEDGPRVGVVRLGAVVAVADDLKCRAHRDRASPAVVNGRPPVVRVVRVRQPVRAGIVGKQLTLIVQTRTVASA